MKSLVEPEWLDPYFGGIGQMPPIRDATDRLHNKYVNTEIDVARDEITKRLGMNAYLLAINLETYEEDPGHSNEAKMELIGNVARLVVSADALAGIEREIPAESTNPATGERLGELKDEVFSPLWAQISILALRLAARDLQVSELKVEIVESFISDNRHLLTQHFGSMIEPKSISDAVVYAMAVARDDVSIDPSRAIRAA